MPTKTYKQFLKKLATLNINSRVEIGLDRMKVAPLTFKSTEILNQEQALLYSDKQPKSKGYGVELRIKLD